MDWRVGLVDTSGNAFGSPSNPLSTVPGTPSTGVVSTNNSSTAVLAGAGVFTGTGEDVSAYAAIVINLFTDQLSAASGVSLQFSSDNTHWDIVEAFAITSTQLSTGQSYTLTPRAKFFRIVYTNGATLQTAFRLQTVYHVGAVTPGANSPGGQVMNLLWAGGGQFQPVRSALDGVSGIGGSTLPPAGIYVYNSGDGKFYPAPAESNTNPNLRVGLFNGATEVTVTGANALKTDGSGVTQPVSGTVTSNQGIQGAGGTASWQVQGAGAAGSAPTGNPIYNGAVDGSGNLQPMQFQGGTNANSLKVTISSGQAGNAIVGLTADAISNSTNFLAVAAGMLAENGSTLDRVRNNVDVTLLASAGRTTTQTSADIVAYNCQALMVTLDVTSAGTGSVTVTINYKDPASGKYVLLLSGAAVVANSTNLYVVDPRITAATNLVGMKATGRTFQIVVTANNANSVTYSVGYTLVPG